MGSLIMHPPGTVLRLVPPAKIRCEATLGPHLESIPISRVRCSLCTRRSTKRCVVGGMCERCGAAFHERCYLHLVATETERHTLLATEKPYFFLCRRCRS